MTGVIEYCGKAKASNKSVILGANQDFQTTGQCTRCSLSQLATNSISGILARGVAIFDVHTRRRLQYGYC